MRNLKRNKQTLWYALYEGRKIKYKLDATGDKIEVYTDFNTNPPTVYYEEDGEYDSYSNACEFEGNISFTSSGESHVADFGVNLSDYEAVLVVEKDSIPITETSLIWLNSEPISCDNGEVDPSTADYTVVKLSPSLNEDRYILAKVVRNG